MGVPLYRLTLSCNATSGQGEMQLAWSPAPQTGRTFFVSADGGPGISHELDGREKMGNGSTVTSGLAATGLKAPFAEKTLAISDLFPGEVVVFPMAELERDCAAGVGGLVLGITGSESSRRPLFQTLPERVFGPMF